MLLTSNILPRTYQDLSTIMKDIWMEYQAFDACPNDHIIYYGQYAYEMEWPQCHISRYRTDQVEKKVPYKVLHYIPIIPCLKGLFRCENIAQFMDYHAENRIKDGVIRIPTNGS